MDVYDTSWKQSFEFCYYSGNSTCGTETAILLSSSVYLYMQNKKKDAHKHKHSKICKITTGATVAAPPPPRL